MIELVTALAGGLGAALRFLVDGLVRSRWSAPLPVATTVINTTGSLALGAVSGAVLFHAASAAGAMVAGTGFLGGYTTFSTASFEVVRLAQEGRRRAAAVHAASMLVLGLGAAALGLAAAAAW